MAFEKDFIKPEHPLPKEIQEMKRDETVCQFCGVSYLIHNEIKKSEDEIIQLKIELERYRGFDDREAELKSKLKEENEKLEQSQKDHMQEKKKNESLLEELIELAKLKKDAETDRDSCKDKLKENSYYIKELKSKNKKLYSSLGYMQRITDHLKGELGYLVIDTNKQKEDFGGYFSKSDKLLALVRDKYCCEKIQFLADNEKLKTELTGCKSAIQEMEVQIAKLNDQGQASKELETALELKLKEIESLKAERKSVEMENGSLSDDIKKMKATLSEKNLKLEKMQSSLQAAEESLKNAKDREVKLEEDWRKGQESLYLRIKELETEIENLKVSRKEENEAVATSTVQIKVLKECLDKSKTEASLLKNEREEMIEAHQNRIKQLRESFNQKMLEADAWPKKLEDKLEEQQRKLNEEKSELWKELTASFQKEMENLKNTHMKEKEDIAEKEKLKTSKIRGQLETLQKRSREELDGLKALLSKEKEKHDKINRSQEALIQNLEFKILDLEKRLLGLQQKSVEEDPAYKQKYIDTKRALEYLRSDFNRLEKDLANSKEEIGLLQETVRRECEERFELTEALSEARLQLITLQRRPSLTRLSQSNLVPSPPSTTNTDRNRVLRSKRMESMEHRINSTQCSASQEAGISFNKAESDEDHGRKRIAEAVAKQRASTRASFDKF